MRIGSLCSGIGGLELGLEWAGLGRTVWQVEIDPFCRAALAELWPESRRFEDVRKVGKRNLDYVDLMCFGFPCTDVSSAGKKAGLSGARSGLFYECARVVSEIGPQWVVVENVASGAKHWVDPCSRKLEQLGYATLSVPVSACDAGALHERARVFIVAHRWRALAHTASAYGSSNNGTRDGSAEYRLKGKPSLRSLAGGPLNPRWCEWYMGFPKDWTRIGAKRLATRSCRNARKT